MKKALLFVLFLTSLSYLNAQVVYEDFEGGVADVAWIGLNGTYNGVVNNPAPDAVNGSEWVGSYTNNATFDFNFALGTMPAFADLSKFNLIRMKVWSPIAPIQALFKFEGGGNAVEMFREIKTANEWVELSFDVSPGAGYLMMDKILVSFNPFVLGSTETFYFDDIVGVEAIQWYETFETGNEMGWQGLDGELTAPFPNPDSSAVNGSDSVGRYVKSGTHAYSLLLADTGVPFDLSILNQFHLHIWSQVPSQVLLKLEGPGGAIERTKNIGLVNEWQDYTFDFSDAADNDSLTKAILFFDPGVETSKDTYYFDNLRALPEGACKNVVSDPLVVDDFECNRNATYVNGWDSLHVVNNPAPDAVNTSAKVGEYRDPLTEQWAALLIDYQNPIDLSTNNQLKIKVWSPRVVPILFKLEGGSSAPKEIWMDVPEAGKWVEYTIDFSSEALNSHRKIVLFFNAGQDPQAGDIYFIDDIRWAEKTNTILEDFEAGAFLPWEPLDGQTLLHGTFAVSDNPDPAGVNQSAKVGEYHKGTATFSTLAAVAPGIIDITVRPQYNVDVYGSSAGTVTFQLESVSAGNKEVTRDLPVANEWTTLSFDFTDHQGITDWESMRLIFNGGVEEEGAVYYFDNVTQSERTIDPCEGTVVIANIIDDFECQRNQAPGLGNELLSVVNNPHITTGNSSTYVGLYHDQPDQPWTPLCYEIPGGIDLSSFNQMSFQILSTQNVPILMKLENGSQNPVEIWTASTTPGEWETLSVDFSDYVGTDYKRACIFFNAGVTTTTVDDYYIDNVQFAHAPFTGCIMNFDDAAFISTEWKYFPSDDSGAFAIVDNPDPGGINTSPKVGQAIEKASSGQPWQGMYTDLPAPIQFGADKLVRMKIYSPQVATVTMKIEHPLTPGAPGSSGDVTVPNTVANEWEELVWDFSSTPITDDGMYNRITLIWDINNIPANDVTYYFDDIQLTGGQCSTTSIGGGPNKPGPLAISPNPVTDELFIQELGRVERLDIFNMFGQRIASVHTGSASSAYVGVSALQQGTYVLSGFSSKGELLAVSRFVKL